MSATAYSTLIAKARAECDDPVSGKPVMGETPVGTRDSSNTIFRLNSFNILTGTIGGIATGPYYTYGTSIRLTTGFSLTDAPTGYVTIAAAPDQVTQPFYFDYRHLWYLDADYNTWIDSATEELSIPAGTATVENLYPALTCYVVERFWLRRASDYADKFGSSAGGASESVQSVCQNYINMSKLARAKGDKARIVGYVDPGQKAKPASATITTSLSPYTPRR